MLKPYFLKAMLYLLFLSKHSLNILFSSCFWNNRTSNFTETYYDLTMTHSTEKVKGSWNSFIPYGFMKGAESRYCILIVSRI